MERLNGGLKDIFSTILSGQTERGMPSAAVPGIVIHGNGNVIAPGGTVHVVQQGPRKQAGPRRTPPAHTLNE